ncbi:MAG: class I SAM-dependent methyltransferase [Deltaproteobacteria bacterium]|nr:class I SAM-dependent methyltransferase [Deltaproteobacteria bacterium]
MPRHHIQFPRSQKRNLEQDEVYFFLTDSDEKKKIRFHDYKEIYKIPGLYEQIFYDRLKCKSPVKVTEILQKALLQSNDNMTELRVLDLGAGNGMMGEELKKYGVARLVGVDIIPEAYEALERDRPGYYDDYDVADFCNLNDNQKEKMKAWSFDCLVTVAALGFGDIPPMAFIEAFNLLQKEAWVAFNIKETFLDKRDTTGFSNTIRELIFSKYMDIYHLERYRHRLSIEGEPLYYFAVAGRKTADISDDFIKSLNLEQ